MSAFFPHVDITALEKFAVVTAAALHPVRMTGRRALNIPTPEVASVEDVKWAGEMMIQITFQRTSLPLGPYTMMAYFPHGRKMLTTQAVIGMMTTVRSSSSKIEVPKIYGYRDVLPNDIGAEVVLMEKVAWADRSTAALLHCHTLCTDTRRESSGCVAQPHTRRGAQNL
ncbi:hypothetical protein DFH29DRAFT_17510 [Suillus ampliporus]|nr:hypothetical protein DFH29DRAFT_17510 [Suillus ampliporus]